VIDQKAFAKHRDAIERPRSEGVEVLVGGGTDDSEGWFVEPTVLVTDDPTLDTMERELFGPILTCTSTTMRSGTRRSLVDHEPLRAHRRGLRADRAATGRPSPPSGTPPGTSTSTTSPPAPWWASSPSGGARLGHERQGRLGPEPAPLGLPRSLKETFVPPLDWRYPHMG
jgi:1-pyrroline-5-carboxylate dehydrogenase